MTTASPPAPAPFSIGGQRQEYTWHWAEQPVRVVYETLGQGSPVLLLPAFSTVSTRTELKEVADRLASQFQVTVVDWPGFGESDRAPLHYREALYHQFVQDFVTDTFQEPIAVLAAGHAAGYAMRLAHQEPSRFSRIVLAAPTWRGPLASMTGQYQSWFSTLRQLVRSPFVGQFLYFLNTTPWFLRLMYGEHVYADKSRLSAEFIKDKWRVTQRPNARFAPIAFVTGALDPVSKQSSAVDQNRSEYLSWFQPIPAPILVVVGDRAPKVSREEMERLAELPGVTVKHLPGSLGLYEEYAADLADLALPFLQGVKQP